MKHTDDFDIWKWSKQALGIRGIYWAGLVAKENTAILH
jgi:hypothetical protein